MKQAEEVSEQGGFRRFMVVVLAAALVGLLVRLAFSPRKIEKIIRSKIEASALRENITFGGAEISLADGWLPDFALVLNRVEWRKHPTDSSGCGETAPVRARLVRVPLRMSSLVNGEPSAGSVKIDDLTVDLDDLKRDCAMPATTTAEAVHAAAKMPEKTPEKTNSSAPAEVWSSEDQKRISSMITGVRVTRAEIFFENRMKSVVVEDATAEWRGEALDVSTLLRFPPATVFGENLPTFSIRGTVHQHEMLAEIRADLNEGTLEANAILKPFLTAAGVRELEAELKLTVSDLPLSVVTPLLSKSGIVTGTFRPKFMWLDCNAEVHGVFSRLFIENPVSLSQCEISGQVGKLQLASATRLPSGAWKPFEVSAEKVDIARVFETFELQGPTGVFANFGMLTGKLNLNSAEDVRASAAVNGAVIRFAGSDGTALQPLSVGKIEGALLSNRWKISLSDFVPDGGSADLKVTADLERTGSDAKVDVELKKLKLNPRVEKVIFTGPVEDITGAASFALQRLADSTANVSRLKADLKIRGMLGSEIDADEVKIEADLSKTKPKGEIEVTAKSTEVKALKSGRLFKLLQPALLGWAGDVAHDGNLLVLGKVAIRGRFRENGFQWQQATAHVAPSLNLSSHGHIYRDHAIDAELEAQYPLATRLRWNVAGTWLKPKFSVASTELSTLYTKAGLPDGTVIGAVPPRLLGLPKDAISEASPAEDEAIRSDSKSK